ncbi:hypothetical protein ABT160_32815 [Streptomyces sp. NPDC001941]|uniref:hypothetical protein n=1 Tax=Streptomyces sp. NPDC001941 TaxID=3154659 RepID=UPI00331FEB3E
MSMRTRTGVAAVALTGAAAVALACLGAGVANASSGGERPDARPHRAEASKGGDVKMPDSISVRKTADGGVEIMKGVAGSGGGEFKRATPNG